MEHIFFFRTNEDKTATFSSLKKKFESRLSASLYCILTDSHSLSLSPPSAAAPLRSEEAPAVSSPPFGLFLTLSIGKSQLFIPLIFAIYVLIVALIS